MNPFPCVSICVQLSLFESAYVHLRPLMSMYASFLSICSQMFPPFSFLSTFDLVIFLFFGLVRSQGHLRCRLTLPSSLPETLWVWDWIHQNHVMIHPVFILFSSCFHLCCNFVRQSWRTRKMWTFLLSPNRPNLRGCNLCQDLLPSGFKGNLVAACVLSAIGCLGNRVCQSSKDENGTQ